MVKYAEKHGNAAADKHYDTDEFNILYWLKQKLVLAATPAKKRRTRLCSTRYPKIENRLKNGITEKTTTIEIAADDESVPKDIASNTETLPNELIDMIDGIGFSSESRSDLFDN